MKKAIFLVLVTVMALAGCSKDENVKQDPIVGKWHLVEAKSIKEGEVTISSLSACEKKSNFVIKEDETLISRGYVNLDNECKVDGGPEKMEWVKNDNGAYTFKYIQDDGYESKVILKEGILTEVFMTKHNGTKMEYFKIYSKVSNLQ